nr:pentapeptide repeat-containing protein [Streptomyces europaeiscabiei]
MADGSPPPWPHCGHGANPAADPVGCRGIHVSGYTACLAHVTDRDRATYLAGLVPGADVDHRGTLLTASLLSTLLETLRDPSTGEPHLGEANFEQARFTGDVYFGAATFSATARFDGATFTDGVWFDAVKFTGDAWFMGATFTGGVWWSPAVFAGSAWFMRATFTGDAWFGLAKFTRSAWFSEVTFTGDAKFDGATFAGDAHFGGATFNGDAGFGTAIFTGTAEFAEATFTGDANFKGARFAVPSLGPLVCARQVDLSGAVFEMPVTIEVAAGAVRCVRTRWEATAALRLRYATVDLSEAVPSYPVAVTAHAAPFIRRGTAVDESPLADASCQVRVTSLGGVDAAQLVLADADLTDCLFTGAFHLDQLRIEGNCRFANAPEGRRWTRRRVLAEEQHWRALAQGNPDPPRGWKPGPHHPDPDLTPGPDELASTYRALRKALEDAKNEPDAADFYYGEMEMRRHDHSRPWSERALLRLYWWLSGYGLRASRALGWLIFAMGLTVMLLMLVGLPAHPPAPGTTSVVATDTPGPGGAAPGPMGERLSWQRAERAGRTAINSVVFRSAGQDLTVAGTYIEMTSRLAEPVLLALALLAVRGRVKR